MYCGSGCEIAPGSQLIQGLFVPQDETWTDFDGPLWIQYDLFRKNKLPGSKKVNLAKFMLPALFVPLILTSINQSNKIALIRASKHGCLFKHLVSLTYSVSLCTITDQSSSGSAQFNDGKGMGDPLSDTGVGKRFWNLYFVPESSSSSDGVVGSLCGVGINELRSKPDVSEMGTHEFC